MDLAGSCVGTCRNVTLFTQVALGYALRLASAFGELELLDQWTILRYTQLSVLSLGPLIPYL